MWQRQNMCAEGKHTRGCESTHGSDTCVGACGSRMYVSVAERLIAQTDPLTYFTVIILCHITQNVVQNQCIYLFISFLRLILSAIKSLQSLLSPCGSTLERSIALIFPPTFCQLTSCNVG